MKVFIHIPLTLAVLFGAPSVLAQPAPRDDVRRNAQEQIPPALIGTWKLDLAASHYESMAPKMQFRIFDYTHDGKLLVNYIPLSANGNQTAGNWTVSLDGSEGLEYTRPY